MTKYARIQDGKIFEFFETDGDITTMFHPSLIWVMVTGLTPSPELGWVYSGGVFSPPVPEVRTAEVIRMINVEHRDQLLSIAALAIGPLQDAVDLDEATAEEIAALTAWKKFRVAVNRVVLSIDGVAWPDFPPQHYAASIESDV